MASVISTSAWRLFAGLAAWLLSALAIGLVLGHPSIALALALALYVCITLWRLLRVDRWLQHRRREPPPDYDGMWGDIVAVASGLDRRRRFHKQRVIELLREFRRLTSAMPDGAILLNADNEIVWFNERAGRWLKLKRKRDYGVRIENLVRQPEFIGYLQRIQRGAPIDQLPILPMPGETARWVSLGLVLARDMS